LKIESVDGITRSTSEGLFANQKLRDAAFGEDVLGRGFNSVVVEFEDQKAAVLRVRQRHEPRERALADVRDEIVSELTAEKAAAAIEVAAADGLARLEAGDSVSSVAAAVGAEWQTVPRALRGQSGVPVEVLDKAFSLPFDPEGSGRVVSSVNLPDGQALLTVTRVVDGDIEAMTSEEVNALARYVKSRNSSLEFAGLYETVEKTAGVTRLDR